MLKRESMSSQLFSATKNTWFLIRSFTQIFEIKSYFQHSLRKRIGLPEDNWVKINIHHTTKVSPRSSDSQPYLLSLMKSSLLSSTDNYTDDKKGWGIQKTCITSSFFPALFLCLTRHPPILSWTHLPASAWLQERGQSLVPHTMPRFHAPSKPGRQTAFISFAGFISAAPSESLWRVRMIQEWRVTNVTEINSSLGCQIALQTPSQKAKS